MFAVEIVEVGLMDIQDDRWAIDQEKVRALYEAGVRVFEVEFWRRVNGELAVLWDAWGIDGLPADWRKMGLGDTLGLLSETLARKGERHLHMKEGFAQLHLYLMGYRLRYRMLNEGDWETVATRGVLGQYPSEHRIHAWGAPLRNRLIGLVAGYHDWYHNEAPEEWRKRYGPEPTYETILDLGRAREWWSVLEEPLVPGLLLEILKK
jgi:hypothetical protein